MSLAALALGPRVGLPAGTGVPSWAGSLLPVTIICRGSLTLDPTERPLTSVTCLSLAGSLPSSCHFSPSPSGLCCYLIGYGAVGLENLQKCLPTLQVDHSLLLLSYSFLFSFYAGSFIRI